MGELGAISEGFAPAGTSNSLTIAQTGVAPVIGSTAASKTFTDMLSPGATYEPTLTRVAGFTANLLGDVNITISAGGTTYVNTPMGQGLSGAVSLLGLFDTNNGVASFQFTVPSTATGALGVDLATNEPVGALGGSYTFGSATITQVPEPASVTVALLGAGGVDGAAFPPPSARAVK